MTIITEIFNKTECIKKATDVYINFDGASDNICYHVFYGLAFLLKCARQSGWTLRRIHILRFKVAITHSHTPCAPTLSCATLSHSHIHHIHTHTHTIHRHIHRMHPPCVHPHYHARAVTVCRLDTRITSLTPHSGCFRNTFMARFLGVRLSVTCYLFLDLKR